MLGAGALLDSHNYEELPSPAASPTYVPQLPLTPSRLSEGAEPLPPFAPWFLARDVYAYATMSVSVCLSICL